MSIFSIGWALPKKSWDTATKGLSQAFVVVITLLFFPGRAHGVNYYTVTQIPHPPGAIITELTDLGPGGQFLAFTPSNPCEGYFWNGSTYNSLPIPSKYSYEYHAVGLAMNASGIVVGRLERYYGISYSPAEWINGNLIMPNTASVPGSNNWSILGAINDAGTIAGSTSTNLYTISSTGVVTDRGPLPSWQVTNVMGINSSEQIIVDSSSGMMGQLWQNGVWIPLKDPQGGNYADPKAINNNGLIVGVSDINQSNIQPVTWDTSGTAHPLLVPGGSQGFAWDVNNLGQIIGDYAGLPCIWDSDGTYYDLRSLIIGDVPSNWQGAWGGEHINDAGQIVLNFGSSVYLLSPGAVYIPEPASLALLALGTAVLLTRRHHRH